VVGRLSDKQRRLWFRSPRVFCSDGRWYFHTREGIDLGPYESQFEAEIESEMLRELLQRSATRQGAVSVIREFLLASYQMGRRLAPSLRAMD
jgi:hypothetical protein